MNLTSVSDFSYGPNTFIDSTDTFWIMTPYHPRTVRIKTGYWLDHGKVLKSGWSSSQAVLTQMISNWDQRCTTKAPAETETYMKGKGAQLLLPTDSKRTGAAVLLAVANSLCKWQLWYWHRQDAVFCYWSQSWKCTWSCSLDGNLGAQTRSQTTLKQVPCVDNQDHSMPHRLYLPHRLCLH